MVTMSCHGKKTYSDILPKSSSNQSHGYCPRSAGSQDETKIPKILLPEKAKAASAKV